MEMQGGFKLVTILKIIDFKIDLPVNYSSHNFLKGSQRL